MRGNTCAPCEVVPHRDEPSGSVGQPQASPIPQTLGRLMFYDPGCLSSTMIGDIKQAIFIDIIKTRNQHHDWQTESLSLNK